MFLLNYGIMLVHELAHLLAALYLGLTTDSIAIYPFGLNLKLKNSVLYSLSDEIILYSAGPLANILLSLAMLPFLKLNSVCHEIYIKSLALFFINILPVLPLDGGMLLKKLINYRYGYNNTYKIMKGLSIFVLTLLFGMIWYTVYKNNFNPTMCIFGLFLAGNIFMSKEKYNSDLLKELIYCKKKGSGTKPYKALMIGAQETVPMSEIIKQFNFYDNYFVLLTDDKFKIKKILSEKEVLELVMNNN